MIAPICHTAYRHRRCLVNDTVRFTNAQKLTDSQIDL